MPRKKKQPETIKAEVTYSSKPEAPKEVPLIVPATSIPSSPSKVERVAEPKPAGVMITVPTHGKGGLNGRETCQSCGFVMAKGAAYCPITPDQCKAPKGSG